MSAPCLHKNSTTNMMIRRKKFKKCLSATKYITCNVSGTILLWIKLQGNQPDSWLPAVSTQVSQKIITTNSCASAHKKLIFPQKNIDRHVCRVDSGQPPKIATVRVSHGVVVASNRFLRSIEPYVTASQHAEEFYGFCTNARAA